MSSKYKLVIAALVGLAVLAVFLIPSLGLFAPAEDEEKVLADEQFKPTEDPYAVYQQAMAEGSPIVIEFYARW